MSLSSVGVSTVTVKSRTPPHRQGDPWYAVSSTAPTPALVNSSLVTLCKRGGGNIQVEDDGILWCHVEMHVWCYTGGVRQEF